LSRIYRSRSINKIFAKSFAKTISSGVFNIRATKRLDKSESRKSNTGFHKKTGELKTDKTRKTSGFVKKGSKIKGERKWLLIFF
jgi:hypothetical protein